MKIRQFRHIALMVTAALMTGACSHTSDDIEPEPTKPAEVGSVAIGFGAELSMPITRSAGGGELTNSDLQAAGFGVFCWYTGTTDVVFTESTNTPAEHIKTYLGTDGFELMRNQKVEYVNSKWTYTPTKYWPLDPNEKLTFRAYAPYTNYLVIDELTGMPQLPVVVASTDYHNNTQHDPLWGTGRLVDPDTEEYTGDGQYGSHYNNITYEMSGDNRLATTLPADTRNGIVDWYFHHGMAKIIFFGIMSDVGYTDPVTIKSIKIENLYDQGLLDLSSAANSSSKKPTWSDRDGDMTVTLYSYDPDDPTNPSPDPDKVDLSANTLNTNWTRLTGVGVASITTYYLATSASDGVTVETAGWSTDVPTLTDTDQYLWSYQKVTYTDGTTQSTTPAIIDEYSSTKTIASVTTKYLATSSSTGVTTETDGWSTTPQVSERNCYLWSYDEITYSDESTKKTDPACIQLSSLEDTGLLIIPRDYDAEHPMILSVTFETSNGQEVTMSTEIKQSLFGNTVYTFDMTVSNALTVEIQSINVAFTDWNYREANHEVYNW